MAAQEFVWGIDLAGGRLDFGMVEVHPATDGVRWRQWNHLALPAEPDLGKRLLVMEGRLRTFCPALAGHFPPVAIVPEQPAGRVVHPSLWATWAIVTRTLRECFPDLLIARGITPSIWKKGVGLKGNAPKEDTLALARRLGYSGTDHNEGEAVLIAEYAALQLAPQLV